MQKNLGVFTNSTSGLSLRMLSSFKSFALKRSPACPSTFWALVGVGTYCLKYKLHFYRRAELDAVKDFGVRIKANCQHVADKADNKLTKLIDSSKSRISVELC